MTVSNEVIYFFQQYKNFNERKLRKKVGTAVDNSIVEILPPVVDRSVTIALITTRELVMKDFAFDGDHSKVIRAADLIIQNLAGSLALVTCREPLRISLSTNLKRIFEEYINEDLKVEIVKSSTQNSTQEFDQFGNFTQNFNSQGTSNREFTENRNTNLNNQNDANRNGNQITEEKLNDIASVASRENLELGCMLIKQKVIEKALKKVREDIQLTQAIDNRLRC